MDFYRADFTTIMSGLVVRYYQIGYRFPGGQPEINAGREGVSMRGNFDNLTWQDIEDVSAVLRRARLQCKYIKQHGEAMSFEDHDPDCVVEYRHEPFIGDSEVLVSRPRKVAS